jgi:hypothetical protein
MDYIVRFIGDPTGYRVPAGMLHGGGWVDARVGITAAVVRINLDQAYLIEYPKK